MNSIFYRVIFNLKNPSRIIFVPLEKIFSKTQDFFLKKTILNKQLQKVFLKKYISRSAISDHIKIIYDKVLQIKPKLIVELGTNQGYSTKAFLGALDKNNNGRLISIDIQDFKNIKIPIKFKNRWFFFHDNDLEFSKKFKQECNKIDIKPSIDILFIDTTHEFNHTLKELKAYTKFMKKNSIYIFHDSNLNSVYHRNDKTIGFAFNNSRGVIRAIEKFFNIKFDEKRNIIIENKNFHITHLSNCCGLTIIKKL